MKVNINWEDNVKEQFKLLLNQNLGKCLSQRRIKRNATRLFCFKFKITLKTTSDL